MKRVMCVEQMAGITINKNYEVLSEYGSWYFIKDDNGDLGGYRKRFFEPVTDEITDLQTANAQLTDRLESLEKVIKENSCEIGRMSAILEVLTPTIKESRLVDRPNFRKALQDKKEFKVKVTPELSKELQIIAFDEGYLWGTARQKVQCLKHPFIFFDPDSRITYTADFSYGLNHPAPEYDPATDTFSDEVEEPKPEPKPEKELYLDIWGGNLFICYGTGEDIDDECLWHIDSEDGKIYASVIMPELWNEWQKNGCKFDPEPVKWTGMCDEKEYRLEKIAEDMYLRNNFLIFNIFIRSGASGVEDKNILTDKAGRAFIV